MASRVCAGLPRPGPVVLTSIAHVPGTVLSSFDVHGVGIWH